MKRLLLAGLAILLPSTALAWEPVHTHPAMATRILQEPRIAAMLTKHGFSAEDVKKMADHSLLEPPKEDQSWGNISSWSSFRSKWGNLSPTVENIWKLLHAVADAAVPVTHGPAYDVFRDEMAQTVVEMDAMLKGSVANWPSPHYYSVDENYYSSYDKFYNAYTGKFTAEMKELSARSRDLWWHGGLACTLCDPKPAMILGSASLLSCFGCDMYKVVPPSQAAALKLAREVLYAYLYCHYYKTWDAPFPQFSPNYPGYSLPYVSGFSENCNAVTLSEGNDSYFPVKLPFELGPQTQYTGDVEIAWGDGVKDMVKILDTAKVCRTENTCQWKTFSHQYNSTGTHVIDISYLAKDEYVVNDSPDDPITNYSWHKVSSVGITTTSTGSNCPNRNDILASGKELGVGSSITSPNGRYHLTFQSDGNFVLYDGTAWIGQTHTYDHTPRATRCVMQTDGNLVLYAGSQPVWNSQTWTNPGAYLQLKDDGSLAIRTQAGTAVWTYAGYRQIFPGHELANQ